jgi:hypothetical protein
MRPEVVQDVVDPVNSAAPVTISQQDLAIILLAERATRADGQVRYVVHPQEGGTTVRVKLLPTDQLVHTTGGSRRW